MQINDKKYDTARNYDLFSIESTVPLQWDDGGLWTHGTVVGRGDHYQNNRSYTIIVTKTGCFITRNSKHFKTTPITVEQYLRDESTQHTGHPLDKILKQYESPFPHNMQNNDKNWGREETDMSNHSDM